MAHHGSVGDRHERDRAEDRRLGVHGGDERGDALALARVSATERPSYDVEDSVPGSPGASGRIADLAHPAMLRTSSTNADPPQTTSTAGRTLDGGDRGPRSTLPTTVPTSRRREGQHQQRT